jgi:hypothetical protein
MYRGKVMAAAAAVFAIGAAFAAQPISTRADRLNGEAKHPTLWAPGTNAVMSMYESTTLAMAPPQ